MANGYAESGAARGPLKRLLRSLGLSRNGGTTVRDTIEELIEEKSEDEVEIDLHERALIRNVLGLRDISAVDVMVPRADIFGVDVSTSLSDLAAQMAEVAHSRLPVYRETLDDVVGMVHIKDVLAHLQGEQDLPLSRLLREVLFVAPSIRALDLLHEMRVTRRHLALVVDEYGGIDGLITVEDLVEEIVGEIVDEHDAVEGPKLVRQADGTVLADGRATVEEFEDFYGPVLTEEERDEIDTLGGLVANFAGRVVRRGEVIHYLSGLDFEIVDSDPRRVKTLRIRETGGSGDTAGD
ncbi:MAG: HlyC/CorC family transporter [Rhodospirillaceae bacterium]|jgi:magnesium and cobalt transporter|nr:HlyC/CorC family transporter [Rhodospirillaceae bacterium]MBT6139360.1 HlyC/CorC family transporter [Rhodospirillaceae bacterium]